MAKKLKPYVVKVKYIGHGFAYVDAYDAEDARRRVEAGEMDSDECIEVELDTVGSAEENI